MTLSQLALEDVEALCLGPSFLMADPMGPLLDQDEEEALSPSSSLEGKAPASPPLSFSSYATSLSPYQTLSSSPLSSASPPPSPPPTHSSLFLGTKAGVDSLSLPWLGANDLFDTHVGADHGNDDAFAGMEWMSEKTDLNEFDWDSLIGSCSSDDSPSSPEELIASLDSHMELDLESFNTTIPSPTEDLGLSLASITCPPLQLPLAGAAEVKKTKMVPHQEVVMKSEPLSPVPSPASPQSYTLELGSEVDVLDAEKMVMSVTAAIIPDLSGNIETTAPIVGSISTSHIVVVFTNEEEPPLVSVPSPSIKTSPPSSDCEDDSGIESVAGSPARLPTPPPTPSPAAGSSRTKPYSKPEPTTASSPAAKVSKVKSVSGAPKVVEKKLKKMEQNKTAATRYRQKKRVEQDQLNSECEELEKRNRELTEKAESISREIQYLKDLMEEVRKHRRGKTSSAV
ncbi:cyclic AMP-dependent transcription factor ATF-4 isoform X2 [Echeneis naucrates]|uniref:cyclic AMP-dependent transcription factor ATF-4 isoform X2 n=1 Tax=Echeneis naucrates TaxID=173247 RepID=UPI001113EB21|nr:cyclic AMP-dependent transcription factor ATF-4-like isoform X2 [Echeneis naucrates]